ncbi:MAG: D-tyrosyl-tRNA(Tyr) deacylase [Candidatus Riflebacteria bacterium]|nr:D-tyrosyl-tRNA(Tyr) deacylase [Candidatus Riflebacteria bacterium]
MRAVVQRVREARVTVDGRVVGQIGPGMVALVGIHRLDTASDVRWMAQKLPELRVFEDEHGKMNLSLEEVKGQLLLVSQFTLYGDVRKGRRPNFMDARRPEEASPLLDDLVRALRERGLTVATGTFGAMMDVSLVNTGPVTIILESPAVRGACPEGPE